MTVGKTLLVSLNKYFAKMDQSTDTFYWACDEIK